MRLAGANLQVRGSGWKEWLEFKPAHACSPSSAAKQVARAAVRTLLGTRVGGHLDYDTMLRELRHSVVVLGLNEGGLGPKPPKYLKLRDLEFPGMGCCFLTQHNIDFADIFALGQEAVTFRTPWEASCLAKDLARHPSTCREMGRRARKRVLGEHTWSARLPILESRL
jgi:hypothetical protein